LSLTLRTLRMTGLKRRRKSQRRRFSRPKPRALSLTLRTLKMTGLELMERHLRLLSPQRSLNKDPQSLPRERA
ncbi:MAG: hypothetical protein M3329_04570, partial [Pseudomonadota bacterium]|nr:hypothetical protein [Pseudomonadota bacterium]